MVALSDSRDLTYTPPVNPRIIAAVATTLASCVVAGFLVATTSRVSTKFLFQNPSTARLWSIVIGLLLLYLLLRCFWRPPKRGFLIRVVVYAYGVLLFFGLAAYEQLVLFKRDAWPIASTQPFPAATDIRHAFWIGIAGLVLLTVGAIIGNRPTDPRDVSGDWDELLIVATVLAWIGLLGAAIVTFKTHTIPLFAHNIDALRFSQGSGLGYASLLEVCLLGSACVSGAALIHGVTARSYARLLLIGSLGALIVFRVERTPILVATATLLFVAVYIGKSPPRRIMVMIVPLAVALALMVGIYRLGSASGPVGRQVEIVHAVFDVSPEFREQAWVYRIYPTEVPFVGGAALTADASSVIPSSALRLAGIDKSKVYGDISHQYVASMQRMGHYPIGVSPLRVGLAGELWADFGAYGLILGLLLAGVAAGLVGRAQPMSPLGVVRKAAASAIIVLALVTPIGALLPLTLMLLGPLFVLAPLLLSHQKPLTSGTAHASSAASSQT